jgi:hypothetical protein
VSHHTVPKTTDERLTARRERRRKGWTSWTVLADRILAPDEVKNAPEAPQSDDRHAP